ncbi:MAG: hypothetical protein OXE82_09450 [Rhodobacter sp.]|nr:hypothetical protein [Rhodobacter sp.]
MSKVKTYTCSYRYKGSTYPFHIKAHSREEAEGRLAAMQFGRVDGEFVAFIPAGPRAGPLVRAICWIRNTLLFRQPPFSGIRKDVSG